MSCLKITANHMHSLNRQLALLIAVFMSIAMSILAPTSSNAAELNVGANQLPVNLGPYLDYFEDPDSSLTIEDIMSGELDWQRSGQDIPTFGLTDSSFWLSIILSGEELASQGLLLSLESATLDIAEFYFVQQGELISTARAGDAVPFSDQLYPFRFPVVPFGISSPSAPLTIYIRAESRSGVEIPLSLSTYPIFATSQLPVMMFYGGSLALFLFSFFACITLYLTTRQHQFSGITMFFASVIPFLLTQTGMGKLWFWGESIEINTRFALAAVCAMLASFCVLGSNLQFESKYRGRLNIVLRFVFYILILTGLYSMLVPFELISAENYRFLTISGLALIATVTAMSALSASQGSKTALYLLLSWLLIFFISVSLIAYKLAWIERASSISVISETLLVMAGLSLLMSVIEFIRGKSEELAEAKMETKAKGDFLRNVSREFLTPVHLILSNSKRLLATQSGNLDEATQKHMTTVINQSDHLHNLINDLLEMAEIESDSFEPEFELLEMSSFLNEIKNLMSPSVLEKGLELNTEYATDNLIVQTDRSRLQHVLVSVITNAIKYTQSGSILLAYKAVYFQRKLGIEISVEDTGRGMSKEFQQQLFKEFSREEEHDEMEPKGTGLGLVIVKRMVEKMGGEISFESQKDSGSTFFIRLPLRVIKE